MSDFTTDLRLLSTLTGDPRRQAIVTCLAERRPPVALSDLATALEAQVSDVTVTAKRSEIDLHHVHLPLLSNLDLVSYDPETNTVDYDPETLEQLRCQYDALFADGTVTADSAATWRAREEIDAERDADRPSEQ